ncbi:MAG TPA: TIM barrel protein [Acidimicrobiales bacterium]|nr:TIM barrel protein [Acidimicrobiales bacterium]
MSVSAISTAKWSLIEDMAFWQDTRISSVGLALKKLEAAGLTEAVERVLEADLTVTNILGLGFDLTARSCWPAHQDRLLAAIDAGVKLGAGCFVLTTGPAGSMTWEEAADTFEDAVTPIRAAANDGALPFAIEHTHSLRADVGFVHTLRDGLALAERVGIDVLLECNACWAERALGSTIAAGIQRIRLVQVSDYRIGTHCTPDRLVPGDGDIPLRRIIGQLLAAGYSGVFDLELIGPQIEAEGYPSAIRRSVAWLDGLLDELGA